MARDIQVTIRAVDQFSQTFRQYNEQLKQVGTNSAQLAQGVKQQDNAFAGLATGIKASIAAYAGLKGLQMVGEMVQLGDAANRAENVFRNLTSSMGGYAANMAALRQATGGIVDDMTLQESGAKLLQMGLAGTTEEMARLSEMAVKLGGAMGMSVEKSFSDFALMLANQSIMRLDQFGISGAKVRAEMNELRETMGLTKEEAFKLAVLDQGSQALDRLGASAEAAQTPMARLQSLIANLSQDFSQGLATGINSLVGLAEIGLGQNPTQIANRDRAAASQRAADAAYLRGMGGFGGSLADMGIQTGAGFDESSYLLRIRDLMASDPDMLGQSPFDAAMVVGGDMFGDYGTNEAVAQMFAAMYQQQQQGREVMLAQISRNYAAQFFDPANMGGFGGLGFLGQSGAPSLDWMGGTTGRGFMSSINPFATGGRADIVSAQGREAVAAHNARLRAQQAAQGQLAQYEGAYGMAADTDVGQFMRRGQADALSTTYDQVSADFERLQTLADQGLISEAELERARTLRDNVGGVADAAQRAADNFENITLAGVFGQGGGSLAGEMTDMVMSQLSDSGMSQDQMSAIQQQLDLSSGRETASSVIMKDQVAPMLADIATQLGPEAAALAIQNLQTFMREAALAGMSQEQIAAALPEATGFVGGGTGQSFTVGQGDTLSQISAQTGIPVQQLLAATGAGSAGLVQPGTYSMGGGFNQVAGFDPMAYIAMIMQGSGQAGALGMEGKGANALGQLSGGQWGQAGLMSDIAGTDTPISKSPLEDAATAGLEKLMGDFQTSIDEAKDKVMEIGTAFEAIPAAVPIRLDLSVNDPSGVFMQLMAALGGADSLGALIADSGGSVPGSNPRGGRGSNGRPNAGRGGNR